MGRFAPPPVRQGIIPPTAVSASREAARADVGRCLVVDTTAAAVVLTLPAEFTPGGALEVLHDAGANTVTVAAGAGATLQSFGALVALSGIGGKVVCHFLGDATWSIEGRLA